MAVPVRWKLGLGGDRYESPVQCHWHDCAGPLHPLHRALQAHARDVSTLLAAGLADPYHEIKKASASALALLAARIDPAALEPEAERLLQVGGWAQVMLWSNHLIHVAEGRNAQQKSSAQHNYQPLLHVG